MMNLRWSPQKISWEAYVHLIWLGYLFVQPFFDPFFGLTGWLLTALAVILFLPVYFWTWTQRSRRTLLGVAVMALLGVLFAPINSGTSGFFIYAAAAAGFTGPPRFALKVVGGVLALAVVAAFMSGIPRPFTLFAYAPVFILVLIIGGANIFEAEKRRANSKLRMAHDEIEHLATIAERERIARDLHDLLGHTLSVITLKSELASRLAERDPLRAAHEMQEVERISREALSEVRSTVQGYRSKGLKAEVANAKLAPEAAGISFDYYLEPIALTPAQEGVLALALREAVTNVVRHAQATHCAVRLTNDQHVRLEVEDNGQGGVIEEGAGLGGMRERVLMQGGELTVTADTGTCLQVTFPQARALGRRPASLEPALEAS